jgi:hypothetical protein
MTQSYMGVFTPNIPVLHSIWSDSGEDDIHGNATESWGDPIERKVFGVYPLHKLPHHDIIGPEYVARIMLDYIMEVPDASVYSKNDQVTWNGMVLLVQGHSFNWGGNNPFGFDVTFFGGSVHLERVT